MYTGSLRTIRKTMRYFRQHVLLHEDVHVFACLQQDTDMNQESWIRSELGEHLKHLQWFKMSSHENWVHSRNTLLENMPICENTRQYLKTSGSILEYYQLQLAYIKMMQFERQHSFTYDYIVRLRTDTLYGKPLDFHWLNWSDEEVKDRLEKIKSACMKSNLEPSQDNLIHYFMSTLLSEDLIDNIGNITSKTIHRLPIMDLPDYIKNGSYILTFRNNLLYIVKRDFFYWIPSLGTFYGSLHHPTSDPVYWWNAESQFESACYHSNLNIHDYSTVFDEKSLYEYDEARYFDAHYHILNPAMVYCLVRY